MLICISYRDNFKIACYPLVITNLIFGLMLLVTSQIVIILSIKYSFAKQLRVFHVINYVILGLSILNNYFYLYKYAKIDTAKDTSPEEANGDTV